MQAVGLVIVPEGSMLQLMAQSRGHRCAEPLKSAPGHCQFPNVHEKQDLCPKNFDKNSFIKILLPPTSYLPKCDKCPSFTRVGFRAYSYYCNQIIWHNPSSSFLLLVFPILL